MLQISVYKLFIKRINSIQLKNSSCWLRYQISYSSDIATYIFGILFLKSNKIIYKEKSCEIVQEFNKIIKK